MAAVYAWISCWIYASHDNGVFKSSKMTDHNVFCGTRESLDVSLVEYCVDMTMFLPLTYLFGVGDRSVLIGLQSQLLP